MLDNLTDRLGKAFDKLTGKAVSESVVDDVMREIRVALLEADVALPVVRDFIDKVKNEAVGEKVVKSVSPKQMVVKIVHDKLKELLGEENAGIDLNAAAPVVVLMAGLQGSGKTTAVAKLAKLLKEKQHKKVMVASADVYRPAAREQLTTLADQIGVHAMTIVADEKPAAIARRALSEAKIGAYDVLFVDTAGRMHIDAEMMAEIRELKDILNPHEILLSVDALIGQDAVNLAKEFNDELAVTGIILSRMDGDSRGGAALSMKAVTGRPIKYFGTGEKVDDIEAFHPARLADRILGMGDVVSLVERAQEKIDQEEAEKVAKRMFEGKFNLNDMLSQIRQIKNMGDIKGVMAMVPGMSKLMKNIDESKLDNKIILRQEAIILSMTPKERKNPDIIKALRKQRIARGAGVSVNDVNKLLKSFEQMELAMKKMKKMGILGSLIAGKAPDLSGLMGGNRNGFNPFKFN